MHVNYMVCIYIYIDFKNQKFQEWHKIAPLNIRASKARTITLAVLKRKTLNIIIFKKTVFSQFNL